MTKVRDELIEQIKANIKHLQTQADILMLHAPTEDPEDGPSMCMRDGEPWPCATAALLLEDDPT